MSTPNPEYDPNWEVTLAAARLRVEAAGGEHNLDDMWRVINEQQYPTLDDVYKNYISRIQQDYPNKPAAFAVPPFSPTMSLDDIRQQFKSMRLKFIAEKS